MAHLIWMERTSLHTNDDDDDDDSRAIEMAIVMNVVQATTFASLLL